MRFPTFRRETSIIDRLILALIAMFILQSLVELVSQENLILKVLSLSGESLGEGYFWGLLTYSFLHDGPLHLIFNLLGLHFIGRAVEQELGEGQFVWLCLISAILGGVAWLVFNYKSGVLIGSSAIVMSCLTVFCVKRPDEPISFLLFFILPIRLKPKIILYAVLGLEVYGFVFTELTQRGQIAHSAHLAGMFAGLCLQLVLKDGFAFPSFKLKFVEKRTKASRTSGNPSRDYMVDLSDHTQFQKEVDRILDKINEHGFGSLSEEEKVLLEKAKSYLNPNS